MMLFQYVALLGSKNWKRTSYLATQFWQILNFKKMDDKLNDNLITGQISQVLSYLPFVSFSLTVNLLVQ